MVGSSNEDKRREWQARVERHASSGLSVAKFCAKEQIAEKRFYYWMKRLKSVPHVSPNTRPQSPKTPPRMPATDGNEQAAAVRFCWKAGPEIWVPADCLEAIRCLAECLTSAVACGGEGFQEVVVKA